MNASLPLAAIYLAQIWLKSALALSHRVREPAVVPADLKRLTIVQPVTSGDDSLAEVLEYTAAEFARAELIWVVDRSDDVAGRICATLKERRPVGAIRVLETEEPPAGVNPKLWKQIAALSAVRTELVAIIDDDTRVPRRSLDRLVGALDLGADLATGLPSYVPAAGIWSLLVAEFVNTSAITTYLSAAACTDPLSINGMCYVMRTRFARDHDVFTVSSRAVTDDLAVAKVVRRCGGWIVQTARPQHISTSVRSFRHYLRLKHRWFVFTRVLVENETGWNQVMLVLAYGLHPLLLGALLIIAIHQPWLLAGVLLARSVTLALLNRIIVGAWRHSPLASIAAELLQPLFFVGAACSRVVWWRRRKIRVLGFDKFEYVTP